MVLYHVFSEILNSGGELSHSVVSVRVSSGGNLVFEEDLGCAAVCLKGQLSLALFCGGWLDGLGGLGQVDRSQVRGEGLWG